MKNFAIITALFLAAFGAILLPARAQNAEDAAVRQAIEHYFRGHATGQGEHFRKVFHPDAKLFAVRDGKYWQLTSEEYISRAPGKPAADEAQRKRSVESVDISGNAAIAKVVLDYPQVKFTDYMSLLKIDDQWMIVNKTFYSEPKAKP
ncbi:MAG TPA: nuclear transport factor 2 family protein [Pyrinomonadaceae bacterium]|nr:nuclear transport factor 2 family protein [Pyrinomonadaceae bacterium]